MMDEGAEKGADEIPFSDLDVNPDDLRAVVSELITNENSLKKLNKKLQQSVDLVEGHTSDLHQENMALSCLMKLLRQAMHEEKMLWEELDHCNELQKQDLHEKWMIIQYLSSTIKQQLITIQELETKKDELAVMLEKDMMNPVALLDVMSVQLFTQHSWEQLSLDVQHYEDLAGAHNSDLHTENMILCNQLESHRQTLDETEKLFYELEDVYRDAAEMEGTNDTEGKRISKLKIENRVLRAQCDNTNRELSAVLSESRNKTCQIDHMFNAQRALQQQLEEEYRLFFIKNNEDLHENWMIHQKWETSVKEHLTTIQELKTKNQHLEVQLKAMVSQKEDLGRLPHVYVEFTNVKKEQLHPEVERDQEPELDVVEENDLWWMGPVVDGQSSQTKSWWRRQVKKAVKAMGTFRPLNCCLGVKRSKKPVARHIHVQSVNSTIVIVNSGKPSVSV